MRRLVTSSLVFALLGSCLPAYAIVYSLQRGRGAAAVKTALNAKRVLRDGVTYNGAKGEIEVYLTNTPIFEAAVKVEPFIRNFQHTSAPGTILIDIPEEEYLTRLMILKAGTNSKTVLFQLRLPKDALNYEPERSWPTNLPKPVNVKFDQVMQLEKSKATFCRYSSDSASQASLLSEMTMALAGDGWKSISSDETGAVFMDVSGAQMVILSSHQGKERANVSIFVRPVKGELK